MPFVSLITYLVGTGYDFGELIRLLFLALDHGLQYGGMIGP